MIISDQYKFVFVHIPKCAGTTVRNKLQSLDDAHGAHTNRVEEHPQLGLLDYVHVPLFVLEQYFPDEFKKINDYWSFVVVRDPFRRFPASFSQHVKKIGPNIQNMTRRQVKQTLTKVIIYLEHVVKTDELLPADYIHFQPQVDYIYLNNQQIVDQVYPLRAIDKVFKDLKLQTGKQFITDDLNVKANQTKVYRNILFRWVYKGLSTGKYIVPTSLKEKARDDLFSFMFASRDKRYSDLFQSDYVKDFIKYFYEKDIQLMDRVRHSYE